MLVRAATVVPFSLILGLLSSDATNGVRAGAGALSAPAAGERANVMLARRPLLRGRVLLPDDGSPLGLRAYVATPTYLDSVDVDATGGFAFALPNVNCDSLDIRIDASGELPRRYHAVRLRVPVPSPSDSAGAETIRALLIPTAFTIAGGTYAGTSVPIVVDAALAGPREKTRYWRVSRRSGYGVPIGWPDDRFPIPVAMVGHFSTLPTRDSASFWAIARQLERDFGRTLFRPISLDSAESEGWSVTLSLDPQESASGTTYITYDGHGDLYNAAIAIRSSPLFSDQRVVTHELLHVLGFGHAVGWYSVMNSSYQSPARATASDVAYAQLFYRLRRVHIEERATHGILASAHEAQHRLTNDAQRRLPIVTRPRGCPVPEPTSALATRRAP